MKASLIILIFFGLHTRAYRLPGEASQVHVGFTMLFQAFKSHFFGENTRNVALHYWKPTVERGDSLKGTAPRLQKRRTVSYFGQLQNI